MGQSPSQNLKLNKIETTYQNNLYFKRREAELSNQIT